MLCSLLPPSHAHYQKHQKVALWLPLAEPGEDDWEVTCWKTLAEPGEYNGQTTSRETWTSTLHRWPYPSTSRNGTPYLPSGSSHLHYLPSWPAFSKNKEVTTHKGVQRTSGTYSGSYITILFKDEWKQVLGREPLVWLTVEMVRPTAGCDYRIRRDWSQAYR